MKKHLMTVLDIFFYSLLLAMLLLDCCGCRPTAANSSFRQDAQLVAEWYLFNSEMKLKIIDPITKAVEGAVPDSRNSGTVTSWLSSLESNFREIRRRCEQAQAELMSVQKTYRTQPVIEATKVLDEYLKTYSKAVSDSIDILQEARGDKERVYARLSDLKDIVEKTKSIEGITSRFKDQISLVEAAAGRVLKESSR